MLMSFVFCVIRPCSFFIFIKNVSDETIRVKIVKEEVKFFGFKYWVQVGKTVEIIKGGSLRFCLLRSLTDQDNNKKTNFSEEFEKDDEKFLIAYSRKKDKNRVGLQYWGNSIDVSSFKSEVSQRNGLRIEIKNIKKGKKEGSGKGITRLVSGNRSLQHFCSIDRNLKMLESYLK